MTTPPPVSPSRPPYRSGAATYGFEHRAFARLDRRSRTIAEAVVLTVVSMGLWLSALPSVVRLWGHTLVLLADETGAPAETVLRLHRVGGVEVAVPYWSMEMVFPGPVLLVIVGLVSVGLFAAMSLLSERWKPGVYLGRAVLLIQISSVLYFSACPTRFSYSLPDYFHGLMATGLLITTATPIVLGLTFYVQDLNLVQKASFTALSIGYSVVLVPVQYALHGLALAGGTAIWMPVLYMFAGIPLHVFALVALYAWAMSWPGRLDALGIPAGDATTNAMAP